MRELELVEGPRSDPCSDFCSTINPEHGRDASDIAYRPKNPYTDIIVKAVAKAEAT